MIEQFNINTENGMAQAVAWFQNHAHFVVDGGTWVVPRSASIYRMQKNIKTITRLAGVFPEDCVRRVAEAAGWTYKELDTKEPK